MWDSGLRLSEVIEKAAFPVMVYADDGKILILSRGWTELSGYAHSDIPTMNEWVKKAFEQRDGYDKSYIDELFALNQKIDEGDYTVILKNGQRRIWAFYSAPLAALEDGRRLVMSVAFDVTDHRTAERELKANVWRLNTVVENAGNGITLSDPEGRFEIFNSMMQEITGYTVDEANAAPDFSALIYPDPKKRQEALARLSEVLDKGSHKEVETTITAKDGSSKTLLVATSMIHYKNSDMFLSVYRDITERKRAEDAVYQAKDEAELLYRIIPSAVFTIDTRRRITSWNKKAAELTGYSQDDVLGKDCFMFAEYPCIDKCGFYAGEKPKPIIGEECIIRRKDGQPRTIIRNVDFFRDSQGNVIGAVESFEDITERKNTEEFIENAYKRMRNILDIAPIGIYVVTGEGEVDYVNQAMLNISGDTRAQFENMNIFELPSYKKLGFDEKIKGALEGKSFFVESVEFTSYYGRKTTIRNFTGIPLSENNEKKVLVFVEDLTEIKRAEKELMRKNTELQKLDKLKSDFISTVSHELRTPLSITKEGINLILDEIPGKINNKQRDVLVASKNNIDRLARIISNLLDISRIQAGKIGINKVRIDMARLVKQVSEFFGNKIKDKGLELRLKLPEYGAMVNADSDKITQVLTNLVDNAVKFTEKGYVGIDVNETDEEVACRVYDTGIGISKDNLPKVFSKFQQFGRIPGAGEKGTGLGLSIAKGIVEAHGGKMSVKSSPRKGTEFVFVLPKE